jgi:DNA-binding protein YbaB
MLDKLKDMWKLRSQMQEIKKQLDNMVIEAESSNKEVRVVVNGSQEIKEIVFQTEIGSLKKEDLAILVKEAINNALKQSQSAAAQKMSSVAGLTPPGAS